MNNNGGNTMTENVHEFNEIELEEETLEEEVEESLEERKIYTDKGDPEIDSLYNKRSYPGLMDTENG
jgi:hypothetical protein